MHIKFTLWFWKSLQYLIHIDRQKSRIVGKVVELNGTMKQVLT